MYKKFKPYFYDCFIALVVFFVVIFAPICIGVITIRLSQLGILIYIMILILFIEHTQEYISLGIKALIDFILNDTVVIKSRLNDQFPTRATVFSERTKWELVNGESRSAYVNRLNYRLIIYQKGHPHLITSEYVELKRHQRYTFTIGTRSRIVISICDSEGNELMEY